MQPEHITGEKVLYGCLDWGSGHLARSIPLLLQLERQGNTVFFCGSRSHYDILRQYGFAGTWLELPGTGFRFKGDGRFLKEGLRNAFVLRKAIRRDRKHAEAYVGQYGITLVVSDHRYGLRSGKVPSVFITHQVQLPPGTPIPVQLFHRAMMQRFGTVWIMDTAHERLAGNLSRSCANGLYIGHYSRFTGPATEESGRTVAIISGPEPYARQLFESVLKKANADVSGWTIVCPEIYAGTPVAPNVAVICNDWKTADEAIRTASQVVSRNGYSTLMDLSVLGKKAILIPTPGQTEQRYLASVNRNADWKFVKEL
jgi:hypothetical protein